MTGFADLISRLAAAPIARLAVAGGDDSATLEFLADALERRLATCAAVSGDATRIVSGLPAAVRDRVTILGDGDPIGLSRLAVAAVGTDGVLVKGRVDSANYLRAVLEPSAGLRTTSILSNVTVATMPSYPRMIAATDNGLVPAPNLAQKRQIIGNAVSLLHSLGLDPVRVAVIAASEKVTVSQIATVEAKILAEEGQKGLWPHALVDGPMGYDAAIDSDAARTKGLGRSQVAGRADLLLFPTIEAANAVVKAWKYHGHAETGSIILGAKLPVLLNSRADGAAKRLNALALAGATRPQWSASIRDLERLGPIKDQAGGTTAI